MNSATILCVAMCLVAATVNAVIHDGDCQNGGTFHALPPGSPTGVCICRQDAVIGGPYRGTGYANYLCESPDICATNPTVCGLGTCTYCNPLPGPPPTCDTATCDCSMPSNPTAFYGSTTLATCMGADPLGLSGPSTICSDPGICPGCDTSAVYDPTQLGTCTGSDPLGFNGPSTICNDPSVCPGCDAAGICDGCNNFNDDCSGCAPTWINPPCSQTDPPTCVADCNTKDLS